MGGAERVISLLLKQLVYDYDVTLVLLSDDIEFDIPKEVNVHVLGKSNILKNKPPLSKLKSTVMFIYKYYRIVKREKFDIAMSFLALPNIINSIIANHVSHKNTHTIVSERCYPSEMYKSGTFAMKMAKIFYPIFYNKNDRLFSNSIHINEDLKDNFGIKIPMNVIYNPIEIIEPKQFEDSYNKNQPFNIIPIAIKPCPNEIRVTMVVTFSLNHPLMKSAYKPKGVTKAYSKYPSGLLCAVL